MPNSKKKGNRGERMAGKVLQDWTTYPFQRVPQSGGLRWQKAAAVTSDLVCDKEGVIFPFAVEVKNYDNINFFHTMYLENPDLIKFWEQAKSDAERAGKLPMLMFRFNGIRKDLFFFVFDYMAYSILEGRNSFSRLGCKWVVSNFGGGMYLTTSDQLRKIPYEEVEEHLIRVASHKKIPARRTIKIKKRHAKN